MKYNFYYDESEHSRKINYETVTVNLYYDNFISFIAGWKEDKEREISHKYAEFENKYNERKKKGELKSDTFKSNQFKHGLASFNKQNVELLSDFLDMFNEDIYLYYAVFSKIEFVMSQILKRYHNSLIYNMDAMKYSITKAILVYHPADVINCIFHKPEKLIDALIAFFKERIELNKKNIKLKKAENEALETALSVLKDCSPIETIVWDYHASFIGFTKFINSKKISDYALTLDKEGESRKTLTAAKEIGINNLSEMDSKEHFGIRIADMLAGIMGKLMKSLFSALHNDSNNKDISKTLLPEEWFSVNDFQLKLYKKLFYVYSDLNEDRYKAYSGIYSDDLISFGAFLGFMSHFNTVEEIEKDIKMLPEYCNSFMLRKLDEHFRILNEKAKKSIKIPVEPIIPETDDYFRNQRGAKVFFDINKQPSLKLNEGINKYYVLSVGNSNMGVPIITIVGKPENICYRLPKQLSEWAMTVSGIAMMGEKLFPSEVIFTKNGNHYYTDIL